jgi:hypothetical protein
MSTEPVPDRDDADEVLDLEVIDLDDTGAEGDTHTGFKSGGSSSGCGYWVDDNPDINASSD